jgi:hypothetical protein
MNKVVEIIQETRKEWSAPELKKVDIEQITAEGATNPSSDVHTASDS